MPKVDETCSERQAADISNYSNVLIVGAGPAGLAVTKCLLNKGISASILDRYGVPGGAYSRMYSGLTLASPSSFLDLPGTHFDPSGEYVPAREFAAYLARYTTLHGIEIETGDLTGIKSSHDGVDVTLADGQERHYPAVVIATGMTDSPNMPVVPGLQLSSNDPLVVHSQHWQGPSSLKDGPVLIIGGGMRGVELAEECARAGLRPMISTRTPKIATWPLNVFGRDIRYLGYPFLRQLPVRLFRSHCSARWRHRPVDRGFKSFLAGGTIVIVPEIREAHGDEVCFVNGTLRKFATIVLATGYRFEMPFLPTFVPRSEQGFPVVVRGLYEGLPNVYFIGQPCAVRLDSHFIHGIAADAPILARDIAANLAARPGFSGMVRSQ